MKKIICIVTCVLAVALGLCAVLMGITRGADALTSNLCTVNLNETFEQDKVYDAFISAGADDCIVQGETNYNSYLDDYTGGTSVVVNFRVGAGDDAAEVVEKANEILGETYFLKYEGMATSVSRIITNERLIALWPAAVILLLAAVYAFVRFGVKSGIATLLAPVFTILALGGIMAIFKLKMTSLTPAAALLASAVSAVTVIFYSLSIKINAKKFSLEEAQNCAKKKLFGALSLTSVTLIVLCVVLLAFGAPIVKNFAVTAIIGTVIEYLIGWFVLPAFLEK